jgi:hypothetical protein
MDMYVRIWACSINMQYEHAAWTCNTRTFRIDTQKTVNIDMQYGHAIWKCKMDIQHGHGYLSRLRNKKICSANDNLLIHRVCKSANYFVSPLI